MSEFLLLRLGRRPDDPIEWLIWNRDESHRLGDGRLNGAAELPQLEAAAGGRPCYALLPQEQVLVTEVQLPNASRTALAAVPFQLEERLCDDPAALHFAVGRPDNDRNCPVAVIARALIDAWRECLVAAPLDVKGLYADAQCLMPAEDRPQALRQGSRLLIAGVGGLALSEAELPSWQPLLEPRVTLTSTPADAAESPLAQLAALLAPERAINLLQGDYRLQGRQQALWRRWRSPAVLSLMLLLLTFASLGFDHYRLSRQQAELDRQVTALFRDALPETRRIVNPRAQLAQRLDALRQQRQGPVLLRLLEKTVPAFKRHASVRLNGLQYSGDGRVLALEVAAADSRSLERFAAALGQDGLRIQPSRPQSRGNGNGNGSTMHLRIEGIDE